MTDPKILLKKLVRASMFLLGVIGVLIYIKYEKSKEADEDRQREERRHQQAESHKMKEEINWEEKVKAILPDQEDLLTPNVLPQIMVPPILNKIEVPEALVYERKKRYTAAYELKRTAPATFWSEAASASGLNAGGVDVRPALSTDIPVIAPPMMDQPTPPRKPKAPESIGKTYIFLP